MKILLSASPSSVFSHKVNDIRFKKQIRILSERTNDNRTWTPVSESSTRISKFYEPVDSEHKFYKTRIENWLPVGHEMGSP